MLPSWATVRRLFLSTVRRFSCGTASTSQTSATCYTAFALINDSTDADLLACMAYVFFPTFILEVDTVTNCHLQYAPLGRTTSLADLNYVQPKFLNDSSASTVSPLLVTLTPDDNVPHPVTPTPEEDVDPISNFPPPEYSISLQDLDRDELIQRLYSLEHAPTLAKGKAGLAPVCLPPPCCCCAGAAAAALLPPPLRCHPGCRPRRRHCYAAASAAAALPQSHRRCRCRLCFYPCHCHCHCRRF